jgi:hypothetical protein
MAALLPPTEDWIITRKPGLQLMRQIPWLFMSLLCCLDQFGLDKVFLDFAL